MLVNIFLLLICYSVIKTVREPLILLGGGAEVRSYAAAGQALLLMGFVPLYSWFASRVDRVKLLVGVTLFFIVCIELFAAAVAARRAVCRRRVLHLGRHLQHLARRAVLVVRQRHLQQGGGRPPVPDHHDRHDRGRAARLVRRRRACSACGFAPQVILQISARAAGRSASLLYLLDQRRETGRSAASRSRRWRPAADSGWCSRNPYLRLIALLIVLLNVVNTTGEYLIARLLTEHVNELALADPAFNKQAYIGAFTGDYQFWVNVTAFLLQAFVTSRLVKHAGLARRAAGAAAHRARRLRDHRGGRRLRGRALDQDGRERDRLLDHEHRASAAVAADDARGEVQGQAGDRHVLRARRRPAVGRRGLSRDTRCSI